MDIEKLKELKDMINQDYMTEDLYSGRDVISEDGEDLISLIDEKISQLSVTDEDVKEAIEQCEYALEDEQLESDGEWSSATFSTTAIRTILTALQQMTPSELCVEEQSSEIFELAVYRRLGITSERAYQLIETEKKYNDIQR